MAKKRRDRQKIHVVKQSLSPAEIYAIAEQVVRLQEARQVETAGPSSAPKITAAKETLPAVVDDRQKRPSLQLLGLVLVQGGLKAANGALKLGQSAFSKDVEEAWMKGGVKDLLTVGVGLTLTFVHPGKAAETLAETYLTKEYVAQPLGKLVIRSLNRALGWSQKKVEKYQAAIEEMKYLPEPKAKDASFADVDAPANAAPETMARITAAREVGSVEIMPPPKPTPVEAQAVTPAAPKKLALRA